MFLNDTASLGKMSIAPDKELVEIFLPTREIPPPTIVSSTFDNADTDDITNRHIAAPLNTTTFGILFFLISQYGAMNSIPTTNFVIFPLPRWENNAGASPKGTQETAEALGLGLQKNSLISHAIGFSWIL